MGPTNIRTSANLIYGVCIFQKESFVSPDEQNMTVMKKLGLIHYTFNLHAMMCLIHFSQCVNDQLSIIK